MSSAQTADSRPPRGIGFLTAGWPVLVGLCLLYFPTYVALATGPWTKDEYAHGPIVLALIVWIIWERRSRIAAVGDARPVGPAAWTLLVVGLLAYILGRSQGVIFLEVGSQIPVLAGSALLIYGWQLLRTFWVPFYFMLFLLPLPGFFVDALTGPLKSLVSAVAEQILYSAGYPIARDGILLTVGQYQLLVADACSGLHSMFSLAAMGSLYLYLMRHPSWLRNGLLAAVILPVAFGANVVRVIILALLTYHFGDAAGQGFVHGFAGVILFVAGLGMLILLDRTIGLLCRPRESA